MTFQGCKGRRQCDSCIPVISVSIDLPLHTCIQVNQILMKKNIEASKYFIYHIFKDVLAIFMTTILFIKRLFILWLESIKTELNVLNAVVIDKLITN